MRGVKIHLKGQFAVDRTRDESLPLQIAGEFQRAIESGEVARGAILPSSRTLARALGVSRNTVLIAYDELKARGLIAGRHGAGMRTIAPVGVRGFDLRRLLSDAQYPARSIVLKDLDGNAVSLIY